MSSFIYFIREALVGFKRNISTAVGSIVTIFLSLLIIGLFLIGSIMINNIVTSVEADVSITIYVADDANKADVEALTNSIKQDSRVKNVGFTNKDQALEKFTNSSSASPEIVSQLDGQNPLPASIDVELNNAQEVNSVASEISSNSLLEKVADNKQNPKESLKYGQKTVDKLFAVTNAIRVVGVCVVVLLIFIAMIFINNTIRLSILARRKEIAIMRLVGASNGFIRGPFFMESCIHSLIGAVCAILVLESLHFFAIPAITKNLAWLPLSIAPQIYFFIYLLLVVAGLVIGLIGSALAMRRYLNV